MEINLSKSSPIDALKINDFIKDVNVPIQTKLENEISGGGNNNGFFGYFKHLFNGFSKESQTDLEHSKQNNSYFSRLFSGNKVNTKETEPILTEKTEPIITEKTEPIITEKTEPNPTEKTEQVSMKEEDLDSLDELETIKIILTTEDPEIDLKESLKGTKLDFFLERSELPPRWV